jgi:hypothetical protein
METLVRYRTLFLALAVILGLVLAGTSRADDGRRGGSHKAFVGLWQAIDSFDGSTQFLSITCTNHKSCDVRLNDTAFTLSCKNQIGFARGEGSIEGDTLTVDLTLYCSNPDGTSDLAATQENAFVLDRRNGTLTNINDDPVPVPNVFHKISR